MVSIESLFVCNCRFKEKFEFITQQDSVAFAGTVSEVDSRFRYSAKGKSRVAVMKYKGKRKPFN
jgi:hypothetical protein